MSLEPGIRAHTHARAFLTAFITRHIRTLLWLCACAAAAVVGWMAA
jgi:hypothetical protein